MGAATRPGREGRLFTRPGRRAPVVATAAARFYRLDVDLGRYRPDPPPPPSPHPLPPPGQAPGGSGAGRPGCGAPVPAGRRRQRVGDLGPGPGGLARPPPPRRATQSDLHPPWMKHWWSVWNPALGFSKETAETTVLLGLDLSLFHTGREPARGPGSLGDQRASSQGSQDSVRGVSVGGVRPWGRRGREGVMSVPGVSLEGEGKKVRLRMRPKEGLGREARDSEEGCDAGGRGCSCVRCGEEV